MTNYLKNKYLGRKMPNLSLKLCIVENLPMPSNATPDIYHISTAM